MLTPAWLLYWICVLAPCTHAQHRFATITAKTLPATLGLRLRPHLSVNAKQRLVQDQCVCSVSSVPAALSSLAPPDVHAGDAVAWLKGGGAAA